MLKLDQYVRDLRAVYHKCLEFNARPSISYFMSSATKLASVVKRAHVVCNPYLDLDSAYPNSVILQAIVWYFGRMRRCTSKGNRHLLGLPSKELEELLSVMFSQYPLFCSAPVESEPV